MLAKKTRPQQIFIGDGRSPNMDGDSGDNVEINCAGHSGRPLHTVAGHRKRARSAVAEAAKGIDGAP